MTMMFGISARRRVRTPEEKQLESARLVVAIEFFFDVWMYGIFLVTGRAVLFITTLGLARFDDGTAEVVGIGSWIGMLIWAGVLLAFA
jgi:hypothetical protein